jgi:hypothetical protein
MASKHKRPWSYTVSESESFPPIIKGKHRFRRLNMPTGDRSGCKSSRRGGGLGAGLLMKAPAGAIAPGWLADEPPGRTCGAKMFQGQMIVSQGDKVSERFAQQSLIATRSSSKELCWRHRCGTEAVPGLCIWSWCAIPPLTNAKATNLASRICHPPQSAMTEVHHL